MIERRKKYALSSESLQFSLIRASIQNIKHCLKLNRVLMKSQSLVSIHEAQGETFANVSGPLKAAFSDQILNTCTGVSPI